MQNILDNYTMDHAQGFLKQIDQQESLARLNRIYEFRVAQLDNKGYKERISQMVRAYNSNYRRKAVVKPVLTPKEQKIFDAQQQVTYSRMTLTEQSQLKSEIDAMWSQIPAHLRDKAWNLGTGH